MLIAQLRQVQWNVGIDDVQELWNWFEQELLNITDKLIPYEEVGVIIIRKIPVILKKQQNCRHYLLRKCKRKNLTDKEKEEIYIE